MNRWTSVWLAVVVLAPTAYAAKPELAIELPNVELALPRASPPDFQKEGLPYQTENTLVRDLLGLLSRGDSEGALALAREKQGAELALIEAGDPDGELARRAGGGRVPGVMPGAGNISATVLYLIGHAYLSLERYAPAEVALKTALMPLPDYLRVHEALGLLYIRAERYDEAQVHLVRAAELGLNTADLYGALGYINHEQNNPWGAQSAYQQALTMDHQNRNWQDGLLWALGETGQYAAALALVEQMLQYDPNDMDLWLYRAHMSLNADQRALALTSLETAIRLGDDSVANLQVCATLHLQEGSIARAIDLLKSASAEDLDFDFLDQSLTWLARENEWDYFRDLLASVDDGQLTDLQRSRALTRRSSLQLHDGNRQAARASLQQAVDLDASNADALMSLGLAYRDERDYNRAELMFQRASAFDTYREGALVSLAQLAIDQEDFERALALLRDVVSRNPARVDLRRNVDSLESLVLLRTND